MKLRVSVDILTSLLASKVWKCFCSGTASTPSRTSCDELSLEEDGDCCSYEATRNEVEGIWRELMLVDAAEIAKGFVFREVLSGELPKDEERCKSNIRERIVTLLLYDEDRDANLLACNALACIVDDAMKHIPAAEAQRDKPAAAAFTTYPNRLAAQMHQVQGKIKKKRARAGHTVGIAAPKTVAAHKQIHMMLNVRNNEGADTLHDIAPSRLVALRWTMGLGARAFKYLWHKVKCSKFISARLPG